MMNNKGFTLVEIIAVLVILSILAVIAVPKFINMGTGDKMATQVVSELNTREKMTWMNVKLSTVVVAEDAIDTLVFSAMNYDVGTGVSWVSGPGKDGGIVSIDSTTTALNRKKATISDPAMWSR
jgi:prepilin-type N-terminal cleavage/methylation domain-containing protein